MIAPIEIPARERGRLRLFALESQLSDKISTSGAVNHLCLELATVPLHEPDVQIVELDTISDMGLVTFLHEAYDIDPAELAPYTNTLNSLTGSVALFRSGAFNGQACHLTPTSQANLVATFNEPHTDWTARPMPTIPLSRTSPRAARSRARRIGFSLFAVMMTLILLLVFWLAT